jgi:hypothetical protein
MTKRVSAVLVSLAALGLVLGCAKRGDEAPAETAASEAPAPAAVPAGPATPVEAPAPPPPPQAGQPGGGFAPPTSITEGEDDNGQHGLKAAEPTTVAEAEKAFSTSNQELEKLIGPLKGDKATGGAAPAPLANGDARCPRACKAFDSLKRAGDAICRLAGDTNARCTRAKGVVKQNATRVAVCGCSDNAP